MHAANNVILFLVHTLFTLYIGALLLRIILSATRADFYNPISQFLVTITDPVLLPLRKILPSIGRVDTASWVLVFGLKALEIFLLITIRGLQASFSTLLATALMDILTTIISIFLYAVIFRAILSWVTGPNMHQHPLLSILNSLTEPVMRPVRKLIPPVGMFDMSALVVIIVLYSILIALNSV